MINLKQYIYGKINQSLSQAYKYPISLIKKISFFLSSHFKLVILFLILSTIVINSSIFYFLAKKNQTKYYLNILNQSEKLMDFIAQDFRKLIFLLENIEKEVIDKGLVKQEQIINKINLEIRLFKILSLEGMNIKDMNDNKKCSSNSMVPCDEAIKICKEVCVILNSEKIKGFLENLLPKEIEYSLSNQYFAFSNLTDAEKAFNNTKYSRRAFFENNKVFLTIKKESILINHYNIILQTTIFAILSFVVAIVAIGVVTVVVQQGILFYILKIKSLSKELEDSRLKEGLLKQKIDIENKINQILQEANETNCQSQPILTARLLEQLLQDCRNYFSYDLINKNIQVKIKSNLKGIKITSPLALFYQIIFSLVYYITNVLPGGSTINIIFKKNINIFMIEIIDDGFGLSLDQFKSYIHKTTYDSSYKWLIPINFISEILFTLGFEYKYLKGINKGNIVRISKLEKEITKETDCKIYDFASYSKNNYFIN